MFKSRIVECQSAPKAVHSDSSYAVTFCKRHFLFERASSYQDRTISETHSALLRRKKHCLFASSCEAVGHSNLDVKEQYSESTTASTFPDFPTVQFILRSIMSPQPNTRRIPACQRCRSRKTKCDSQLPSCATCTKAGVPCMNNDKVIGKLMSRSDIWSLEQKERSLVESRADSPSPTPTSDFLGDLESAKKPRVEANIASALLENSNNHYYYGVHSLLAATTTDDNLSHVSEDVKGELRRYSHSLMPQGARERFIGKENMAIAKLGRDFLEVAHVTTIHNRATDITAYNLPILMRVAKRYFSWMNSAYPVLHETQVYELIKACHRTTEVNSTALFRAKMVIAISLASIKRPYLSTSKIGHISQEFWKSATELLPSSIEKAAGLEKLQMSLLLLQYTLLLPKSGNPWQLAGSAMRYATELGIYAEPNPGRDVDALTLDLRRRMFWTCYCVDRILSTALGRPSSIPDSWITVKMPSLLEDRLISADGHQPGPTCHLKLAAIHQVHICRLQSEIHNKLYAPNPNTLPDEEGLFEWTWHTYDQLSTWRQSFLYPTPLITKEWTELQFHIGAVLLLRPSPNRPNPSQEELHVAFHSAGQVMNLTKVMHREESAVFAWLTVQHLFICGLTYIKYLRTLTKRESPRLCIPFIDVVLQIQTCAAMLETLAALEVGDHEQIRNVYEVASSTVLRELADIFPAPRGASGKECDCIWELLARRNSSGIQRPTKIEGKDVKIQKESKIPLISKLQERDNSQLDDDHFFTHDVDAYPDSGVFHSPQELDLHSIYSTNGLYDNSTSKANRYNTIRESWLSENLAGSFPSAYPYAERVTGIPDIIDVTNDGIERWFLYPI